MTQDKKITNIVHSLGLYLKKEKKGAGIFKEHPHFSSGVLACSKL
jgi:hypothetical protein